MVMDKSQLILRDAFNLKDALNIEKRRNIDELFSSNIQALISFLYTFV